MMPKKIMRRRDEDVPNRRSSVIHISNMEEHYNNTADQAENEFSAVLLAGGKSRRMGFDKAQIDVNGQPLWLHQIETLRKLGAMEVLISGPDAGPWKGWGIRVVEDVTQNGGPMAAIANVLTKVTTPRVLVLAVDMPLISSEFLSKLLTFNRSVVPKNAGYFEPLVAVYTRSGLELLETMLESGELNLQSYLSRMVNSEQTSVYDLKEDEKTFFLNLNEPSSFASITAQCL